MASNLRAASGLEERQASNDLQKAGWHPGFDVAPNRRPYRWTVRPISRAAVGQRLSVHSASERSLTPKQLLREQLILRSWQQVMKVEVPAFFPTERSKAR